MAQITVHHVGPHSPYGVPASRRGVGLDRERLRSVVPVALAVTLLFGVLAVGVLTLRTVLDFGVWVLGTY
ncbi:hypothetical protein [Actinotalea sp. K2]|uniref:hypothetical protein n=1 Tax=Actinotalea sp. K2 TaxID=2939438 RepID=UPI002016B7AE|nr:hypothetical protein [Actinotalea sp. K2]MCL3863048.1 hypothetical protein [Actinotalea sp. K2]